MDIDDDIRVIKKIPFMERREKAGVIVELVAGVNLNPIKFLVPYFFNSLFSLAILKNCDM